MATELNASYEFECLSHYSTQSIKSLFDFNQYIIEYIKQVDILTTKLKHQLNKSFSSKPEIQTRNQLTLCLTSFYKSQLNYLTEFKTKINRLSTEIIIPSATFYHNMSNDYNSKLTSLNQSIQAIEKKKIHLTNAKMSYYKGCYSIQEIETKIREHINSTTNKKKISQDKINRQFEGLVNEKMSNECRLQVYHDEVNKLNQLYDAYEMEYENVIQSFANNREVKGEFIKCIIEKWNNAMNSILLLGLNQLENNADVFTAFDPLVDRKIFEEEFKDSLHWAYEKETFIPYDKFAEANRHLLVEEEEKNKSNIWNMFQFNNAFGYFGDKEKEKDRDNNAKNNKVNIDKDKDKDKNIMTNTIQLFLNSLVKENTIHQDTLIAIFELKEKQKSFPNELIKCYKRKLKHSFCNIQNITNLYHLSNIFKSIIMNITLDNRNEISLTSAIIVISEKIYCSNTFLNALLCKNIFFSNKEYWITLTEHILIKMIQRKINSLIEKRNKMNHSFIDNFILVNSNEYKAKLYSFGLENKLEKYDQLNDQQKKIIDDGLNVDIHNVMKRFIIHFGNYNMEYSDAIELIALLCKKYHISEEQQSYYINYLNVSYLSIRRSTHFKSDKLKYTPISNDNLKNTIVTFRNEVNTKQDGGLLTIILPYCFSFLAIQDFQSLMILNKSISNVIKKKIYNYILIMHPKLPLKTHIAIWESLLDINGLRTKYNYQDILNSIAFNNEVTPNKFLLIETDSKRTFFKANVTQGRETILRILHCVIEAKSDCNLCYCQGMNFIAGFIYEIVKDEEKAFYILLGLFSNTDYYTIYLNHLERLKVLFYICERLLSLYLPELHTYLVSNSFFVKLFGSPWLITLFTNAYPFLLEDDIPNVLLRIWDRFLLKGWKGLLTSLLGLLKYHINDIIKLNNEELYLFMLNNLAKSTIFHNDHYSIFIQYTDSIKITNSLLAALEKEYKIEIEIQRKNTQNKSQ